MRALDGVQNSPAEITGSGSAHIAQPWDILRDQCIPTLAQVRISGSRRIHPLEGKIEHGLSVFALHQVLLYKASDARWKGILLVVRQILLAAQHSVGCEAFVSKQLGVQTAHSFVTGRRQSMSPMDAAGVVEDDNSAHIAGSPLCFDCRLDGFNPAFSNPPVPLA